MFTSFYELRRSGCLFSPLERTTTISLSFGLLMEPDTTTTRRLGKEWRRQAVPPRLIFTSYTQTSCFLIYLLKRKEKGMFFSHFSLCKKIKKRGLSPPPFIRPAGRPCPSWTFLQSVEYEWQLSLRDRFLRFSISFHEEGTDRITHAMQSSLPSTHSLSFNNRGHFLLVLSFLVAAWKWQFLFSYSSIPSVDDWPFHIRGHVWSLAQYSTFTFSHKRWRSSSHTRYLVFTKMGKKRAQ